MKTIAIVGANGLVGEKMTEIIADKLPEYKLRLFGNSSVGRRKQIRTRIVTIESCDRLLKGGIDYAMFAADNDTSLKYVPELAKQGAVCIDNSSAFRLHKDVPLIVPCINGRQAIGKNIIANPNCTTIQIAVAINSLIKFEPIKLTAVTYQASSGAGKDGLCDYEQKNGYGKLKSFPHPIYDNLIPCIGNVRNDGTTEEERKLLDESRKILNLHKLKVNGFCARVPVSVGHGAFVNVAFKKKFDVEEIRGELKNAPNVLVFDDAKSGLYPMPIMMRHTKYVGVGRITKDPTANAVNMFVVADNLLRGAAYNAYEILEYVLKNRA